MTSQTHFRDTEKQLFSEAKRLGHTQNFKFKQEKYLCVKLEAKFIKNLIIERVGQRKRWEK
jgi:hypothetical protein